MMMLLKKITTTFGLTALTALAALSVSENAIALEGGDALVEIENFSVTEVFHSTIFVSTPAFASDPQDALRQLNLSVGSKADQALLDFVRNGEDKALEKHYAPKAFHHRIGPDRTAAGTVSRMDFTDDYFESKRAFVMIARFGSNYKSFVVTYVFIHDVYSLNKPSEEYIIAAYDIAPNGVIIPHVTQPGEQFSPQAVGLVRVTPIEYH